MSAIRRELTPANCGTCCFGYVVMPFMRGDVPAKVMQCRRHAPVLIQPAEKAVWPSTLDTKWCGDYAEGMPHEGD